MKGFDNILEESKISEFNAKAELLKALLTL